METSKGELCCDWQWLKKASAFAGFSVTVALCLISSSATPSGVNLAPLREVYSQDSELDRNEFLYFVQRCSGLMFAANSISGGQSGPLFQLTQTAYLKFAQLSFAAYKNEFGLNEENAMKKSAQTIGEFTRIYIEYMNESYLNSGNYLSGYLIDQDLSYCGQFLKEIDS